MSIRRVFMLFFPSGSDVISAHICQYVIFLSCCPFFVVWGVCFVLIFCVCVCWLVGFWLVGLSFCFYHLNCFDLTKIVFSATSLLPPFSFCFHSIRHLPLPFSPCACSVFCNFLMVVCSLSY